MAEDPEHVVEAHIGKGRLGEAVEFPEIRIEYPGWVRRHVDWTRQYAGERDRMRVALQVARENVDRKTGGPFAAALFESESGRLLSVGLDPTNTLDSSLLHAETIALALGERRLGHRLGDPALPRLELHTTCEPCSMCACAILSSGVSAMICAATREDAQAAGVDWPHASHGSLDWLDSRGVQVRSEVLRAEAREILRLYRAMRGPAQ